MQVAPLPLISDSAKVVGCLGLSFCFPVRVARRSFGEQATGALLVGLAEGVGEAALVLSALLALVGADPEGLGLAVGEAVAPPDGDAEGEGVTDGDGTGVGVRVT